MHRHQQLSHHPFFITRTVARALALLVVLSSLAFGAGCVSQGVTVEWTTATEEKTAGFNLYRADTPDGNYVKINSQLIPGAADPLKGGQYQFPDATAEPGHTYYYKLEEVEIDGRVNWHGPIKVTGDSYDTWLLWGLGGIGLGFVLGSVFLLLRRRRASR